jgi:DNA recombination protein RmuC
MPTEILLYVVIGIQIVLLALVLMRGRGDQEKLFLQSELSRMSRELAQALADSRKESSENLSRNFGLIFENQRAGVKDQNESLRAFGDVVRTTMQDLNNLQREKFGELSRRQDELVKNTEMRLEKIRETVDEKLQKTLEARLGQSFELVSNQLHAVQKGLGEMQSLANGVGDLKRVYWANISYRPCWKTCSLRISICPMSQ